MLEAAQEPFSRWWSRHQTFAALVLTAFVLGSLVGALALQVLSLSERADLALLLSRFLHDVGASPGIGAGLFGAALLTNLKVLGLIYVLGVSVAGFPLVLLALFFRGFVLGFAVGVFVTLLHGTGFWLAVVAVALPNLVLVPAWLTAGAGGLGFSWRLLGLKRERGRSNLGESFAEYTLVTLAGALVVVFGSALEVLATPLLLHWLAPLGI
ncbi:MAG: stage II sporulation protein M [Clostridia bacterium]